jgi:hypothetical protein
MIPFGCRFSAVLIFSTTVQVRRSEWDEVGNASLSLTGFAAVAFAAVLYDWGEQNHTFRGYH